ncbi:hypothetical protein Pcinc_000576 [Petrolisthes cinctipes]|uniref:Uncharacterized protein n=1 Tax=Petrolisthes cinctipes TaxID=88211 RepID=A0AAE1GS08_PETCI|nr:hypothetical protein Pcinc_000576 [Petrolisthes cinctipes]
MLASVQCPRSTTFLVTDGTFWPYHTLKATPPHTPPPLSTRPPSSYHTQLEPDLFLSFIPVLLAYPVPVPDLPIPPTLSDIPPSPTLDQP